MSSVEVPYSHIPQETEAANEGFPEPIEVGRLAHLERNIGAHLVDSFLEDPARLIKGFETLDLGEGSKHNHKDHVLGTVPAGPDEAERVKITADAQRPGSIANGIHRAKKIMRANSQLQARIIIESVDIVFPHKQLPLFETE